MGQNSSQPVPLSGDMPGGYAKEQPTRISYGVALLTEKAGLFGAHQTENWFYLDAVGDGSALTEPPRPYHPSLQRRGTPLSLLNQWPKQLNNATLFQFLCEPPAQSPHKDFYDFVKKYYQSSCAIVVQNAAGHRKIVGSGGLIKYSEEYHVVTARHVVEHVANEKIFVRFFRYTIGKKENRSCVFESSIDLPVLKRIVAKNGVDGCYLHIALPVNKVLFSQHTNLVELANANQMQSLASGRYALFHFAYGQHQVSLGEIRTGAYLKLHDNIRIQAGSGASGAMLLHHVDHYANARSVGISVYRFRRDGYCDNRVIAYNSFVSPRALDDVTAPFRVGKAASDITQHNLEQSGYEYVDWARYTAGGGVAREESPDLPMYDVLPNHSNHHILPIRTLQYLWDYFHLNYDRGDGNAFQIPYHRRLAPIVIQNINKNVFNVYHIGPGSPSFDALVESTAKAKFEKLYSAVSAVLDELCWPLDPGRENIAWSHWNLFKGWNSTIRGNNDPGDEVEPHKPVTFDANLWDYVQQVNRHLNELTACNGNNNMQNCEQEKRCHRALRELKNYVQSSENFQRKVKQQGHFIHLYHAADWDKQGHKNGHDVWHVKK